MEKNNNLVECNNISKSYYGASAVSNIDIKLPRDKIISLLGLNGAGKTTTLSMISGILTPSKGEILIDGKSMADYPIECKSKLGFLPEQTPLYTDLTVSEYLEYCAKLRRMKKKEVPAAIKKVIVDCGLSERTHQIIGNLSKGYKQRVAIAGAIVHSPALVILDEPTSGLDPVQITQIRDLIVGLKVNRTIILSTHILSEAEMLSDQVLIMHKGKIVLNKDMSEIGSSKNTNESLEISFTKPLKQTDLLSLSSVKKVDAIDVNRFSVVLEEGIDNCDEILSTSVSLSWGLQELSRKQASLEKIFLEITK